MKQKWKVLLAVFLVCSGLSLVSNDKAEASDFFNLGLGLNISNNSTPFFGPMCITWPCRDTGWYPRWRPPYHPWYRPPMFFPPWGNPFPGFPGQPGIPGPWAPRVPPSNPAYGICQVGVPGSPCNGTFGDPFATATNGTSVIQSPAISPSAPVFHGIATPGGAGGVATRPRNHHRR